MSVKVTVVSASLSENSSTDQLGDKIGAAVVEAFRGSGVSVEVVPVRLRGLAHSIANAMLTNFPDEPLEQAFDAVESADAVIAVTPAYNASYSGLFKSFFDVLPEDVLRGTPMILGATGGTPRHSLVIEHELRPLFMYLHAVAATTGLYVATEDWGAHASDSDASSGSNLDRRIARAARELRALIEMSEPQLRASEQGAAGAEAQSEASLNGGAKRSGQSREIHAARATAGMSADELTKLAPDELYPDFKSFDQLM